MNIIRQKTTLFMILNILIIVEITVSAVANEYPLYAGWASVDITPDKPVNLVGQMTKRISQCCSPSSGEG